MQILLAAHLDRLDLLCKMQTRPVRPGKIRKVVLDGFPSRTGKIVSIMTLSSSSPQKVKKVSRSLVVVVVDNYDATSLNPTPTSLTAS